MPDSSIVAFIPARGGSKRVERKNLRLLNGHPMIAYSIAAAFESGCFNSVWTVTDDDEIEETAMRYGSFVIKEPKIKDLGLDIRWVRFALSMVDCDAFAILRPTSPFRTAPTIRRAVAEFNDDDCDSLRAVEPVKQTPYKMWRVDGSRMYPVLVAEHEGTPLHSTPTQLHPMVYAQNASLEIARRRCVEEYGTISGRSIRPFFTEGMEGFDINTWEDFVKASYNASILPKIKEK